VALDSESWQEELVVVTDSAEVQRK